jgi:hypothetical protein
MKLPDSDLVQKQQATAQFPRQRNAGGGNRIATAE